MKELEKGGIKAQNCSLLLFISPHFPPMARFRKMSQNYMLVGDCFLFVSGLFSGAWLRKIEEDSVVDGRPHGIIQGDFYFIFTFKDETPENCYSLRGAPCT